MNKRKILVPLGDKSYEVTLEAGILNNISEELLKIGITKNRKILVISNEEISNLYGEKFLNNLKDNQFQAKIFLIKAGESYKNLQTLIEIYNVAFVSFYLLFHCFHLLYPLITIIKDKKRPEINI